MDIYLKLFEVLFPVFFIVGIGFLLGKKNPNFDTSFITTYAGNFGTPALVIFAIALFKPNTKILPKKSHNKKRSYLLIFKIIEPSVHMKI